MLLLGCFSENVSLWLSVTKNKINRTVSHKWWPFDPRMCATT